MHSFSYNRKSLASFGFGIVKPPQHSVAVRKFKMVTLPGGDGSVISDDNGYENIEVSYTIKSIISDKKPNLQKRVYDLIDWLGVWSNDYFIFSDTYNRDYFTKAIVTNIGEIEQELSRCLSTTVKFSRLPFWYSYDGQKSIRMSGNILRNPEQYASKPRIMLSVYENIESLL